MRLFNGNGEFQCIFSVAFHDTVQHTKTKVYQNDSYVCWFEFSLSHSTYYLRCSYNMHENSSKQPPKMYTKNTFSLAFMYIPLAYYWHFNGIVCYSYSMHPCYSVLIVLDYAVIYKNMSWRSTIIIALHL